MGAQRWAGAPEVPTFREQGFDIIGGSMRGIAAPATRSAPVGLRDSKLLSPAAREALVPKLQRWAPGSAVGHASAAEVDALGILRALRLAGTRALLELEGAGHLPQLALLDGDYDWLGRPPAGPGRLDLNQSINRSRSDSLRAARRSPSSSSASGRP